MSRPSGPGGIEFEVWSDPRPPALDPAVLAELDRLGGDGDLVHELAVLFLADAVMQIGELDQALAEDDTVALGRAAHRLGGSAGNLGAGELARLCTLLPSAGGPLNRTAVAGVIASIRSELDRVRAAFIARGPRR